MSSRRYEDYWTAAAATALTDPPTLMRREFRWEHVARARKT